jgi:tmRNA-binding protein
MPIQHEYDIMETIKAIIETISESVKSIRSTKCLKIIKNFLTQFDRITSWIDSSPKESLEQYLALLNGIIQTINNVLVSSLCI